LNADGLDLGDGLLGQMVELEKDRPEPPCVAPELQHHLADQ